MGEHPATNGGTPNRGEPCPVRAEGQSKKRVRIISIYKILKQATPQSLAGLRQCPFMGMI